MRIQHILLTAAVSALAVSAQAQTANSDSLTATYAVGFESNYVFRGLEVTDNSLQSNVVLNYDGFYAGAASFLPVGSKKARQVQINELDLVAGYKLTEDKWTFDIGYTYYSYTDNVKSSGQGYNRSNEIKLAASYADIGAGISPTASIYYDYDLECITTEISLDKSFDLGELAKNLSIKTNATIGYADANDTTAGQGAKKIDGSGYGYYSLSANLVFVIDKSFSLYAGPRFADHTNSDTIRGLTSGPNKDNGLLWWGAGITGSF